MGLEQNQEQHYRAVVDKYVNPTTTYSMTTRDYIVRPDGTGGAFTITLPPVAEAKGRTYCIVPRNVTTTNIVTVASAGDSEGWISNLLLTVDGQVLVLRSDGMTWAVISGAMSANLNFSATITTGIDFLNATLTSDANRDNSFRKCGTYYVQKEMTPTDQAYLFQMNVKIMADLGSSKRVIGHYNKLETGGALTATRLKVLENYCVVGHAVADAHVVYGELFYASGYAAGGVTNEGFGGAFTVDTDGGSTPTGLLYGLKVRIKGTNLETGSFRHCVAFFQNETACYCNTRFLNQGAITAMISFNLSGTCSNLFHVIGDCDNLFNFPALGTLPHDVTDISGSTEQGHLIITIGGTQYGIPVYDHS